MYISNSAIFAAVLAALALQVGSIVDSELTYKPFSWGVGLSLFFLKINKKALNDLFLRIR